MNAWQQILNGCALCSLEVSKPSLDDSRAALIEANEYLHCKKLISLVHFTAAVFF
jgi:hypothetical protein